MLKLTCVVLPAEHNHAFHTQNLTPKSLPKALCLGLIYQDEQSHPYIW